MTSLLNKTPNVPECPMATPDKIEIVQRRSNLYIHTYAALDHPTHGQVLVPILQTMYSRSKYMPHIGLRQRVRLLKRIGINKVDVLLEGDVDEQRPE